MIFSIFMISPCAIFIDFTCISDMVTKILFVFLIFTDTYLGQLNQKYSIWDKKIFEDHPYFRPPEYQFTQILTLRTFTLIRDLGFNYYVRVFLNCTFLPLRLKVTVKWSLRDHPTMKYVSTFLDLFWPTPPTMSA